MQMEKRIAREFAEFACNIKFEDIPIHVVEKAKELFLDTCGCIIGAKEKEQSKIMQEIIKTQGGIVHSTVLGCGFKTNEMNAALLNGLNAHILDYDDDHREAVMHPSATVLSSTLALAETKGVSGKEFLRAYVLGSELTNRLGIAFKGSAYDQGFHPTGICGVFGGALAGAMINDLDSEKTAYSIGLAGSLTSGTWEWRTESSWQKPLNSANAAWGGVLSTMMAEKGFVGATSIFDGPDNFLRVHSYRDKYDSSLILKDIGSIWKMYETSIKLQACCRFAASAGDLGVEFYNEGVDISKVKKITVKTCSSFVERLCYPRNLKYAPVTHVDAQFSLPYVVAVGMVNGSLNAEDFEQVNFKKDKILSLMNKIECHGDDHADKLYMKAYPAEIIIEMCNGSKTRKYTEYPKGDPENPATKQEISDKFASLVIPYIEENKIKKIMDMAFVLEELSDIRKLTDLMI